MMNPPNPYKPILLISKDKSEASTMAQVMKQDFIANPLIICESEDEGIYNLNKTNTLPKVILLDVKIDVSRFVDKLNCYPTLRRIPLIILTSSETQQANYLRHNINASGYMVKPKNYSGYQEMLNAITKYWSLNRLPRTA